MKNDRKEPKCLMGTIISMSMIMNSAQAIVDKMSRNNSGDGRDK